MKARQRFTWLAVTFAALTLGTAAQAQIRLDVPEDRQPRFYADFGQGFLPHTEEWAVVIFDRTPA